MQLSRLRIGTRLLLSFAAILALMAFTTLLAVWRLHTVDGMAKALVKDKLAKQQLAADWLGAVGLNGERANAIAKSDSLEVADYFAAQLAQGDKHIAALEQRLAELAQTAPEQQLLRKAAQRRDAYLALREQVFKLKAVGKTIEVEQLAGTGLASASKAYEGAIRALADDQKRQADAIAAESNAVFDNSVRILLALGAAALALGALLAWGLTKSIVKPLQQAAEVASLVAAGDLRAAIPDGRSDEIGILLNALRRMNESLSSIVCEVRDGIHVIDAAVSEISADNGKLSKRTSGQARALRHISASMETITATVKQNAANARHADALAAAAARVAQEGGAVVGAVVQTMNSIHASSQRVNDIIGVIDGIAFQTNILALNAAVEAARAGAHGRGFAVVAAEVRTLAQRSAAAAKEIKILISTSGGEVAAGSRLAGQAGDTMHRVVGSIQQVSTLMAQIRGASEAQSEGLEQVGQSIDAIDGVTRQNAALVEDAVQATASLQQQARRVAASVRIFRLRADSEQSKPALCVLSSTDIAADVPVEEPERPRLRLAS